MAGHLDDRKGKPLVPHYKPLALRWPFLTTLLVLICSLITVLAVGMHRLPIQMSTSASQVLLGRELTQHGLDSPSPAGTATSITHALPTDSDHSVPDTLDGRQNSRTRASVAPRQDWSTINWSSTLSTVDWSRALATVNWPSVFSSSLTSSSIWYCTTVFNTMFCCFGNDGIPGACSCSQRIGTCSCTCGPTGSFPSLIYPVTATVQHAAVLATASTEGEHDATPALTRTAEARFLPVRSTSWSTVPVVDITTPFTTALQPAKTPYYSAFDRGIRLRNLNRFGPKKQEVDVSVSITTDWQNRYNATSLAQTTVSPPRGMAQPRPEPEIATVTVTMGSYFVNMFMPLLLATLLNIPIQILTRTVKLFQPFHAMTKPEGATAQDTVLFSTFGWRYNLALIRMCGRHWGREGVLPALMLGLSVTASLATALSATAVGFQLAGGCHRGDPDSVNLGCGLVPSIAYTPAVLLICALVVMASLVSAAMFVLARWRTGVRRHPWSIIEMARLSLHPGLNSVARPCGIIEFSELMKSTRFSLGYYENQEGQLHYGIIPSSPAASSVTSTGPHLVPNGSDGKSSVLDEIGNAASPNSIIAMSQQETARLPVALGYVESAMFLALLSGIITLILYYHNIDTASAFEDFMDGESFWVKFLFTLLGTIVTKFWWMFFESIAIISPYHCLSSFRKINGTASAFVPRPTNAYSGFYASVKCRHRFMVIVSLVAIVTEFISIFLANVPFNMSELQAPVVYEMCYWVSLSILSIMVVLVLASFLVPWTRLPGDPSTIAGVMYFVVDSNLAEDLAESSGVLGCHAAVKCGQKPSHLWQHSKVPGRSGQTSGGGLNSWRVGLEFDVYFCLSTLWKLYFLSLHYEIGQPQAVHKFHLFV